MISCVRKAIKIVLKVTYRVEDEGKKNSLYNNTFLIVGT